MINTKGKTIAFIDVETQNTCLNWQFNLPWQIGIITYKDNQILEKHNIIINWGDDFIVSKEAQRITGFTPKMMKEQGISPEEALKKVISVLKKADCLVGHNYLGFDYHLMNSFFRKMNVEFDQQSKVLFDTLALAKALAFNKQLNDQDLFCFQIKCLSIHKKAPYGLSLSKLCEREGIPVDEAKLHDAIYDLELNIKYWEKIAWKIK